MPEVWATSWQRRGFCSTGIFSRARVGRTCFAFGRLLFYVRGDLLIRLSRARVLRRARIDLGEFQTWRKQKGRRHQGYHQTNNSFFHNDLLPTACRGFVLPYLKLRDGTKVPKVVSNNSLIGHFITHERFLHVGACSVNKKMALSFSSRSWRKKALASSPCHHGNR